MMRPPGHATPLCVRMSHGGLVADTACRLSSELGPCADVALVAGRYDLPLLAAPAWMRQHATSAGLRPLAP